MMSTSSFCLYHSLDQSLLSCDGYQHVPNRWVFFFLEKGLFHFKNSDSTFLNIVQNMCSYTRTHTHRLTPINTCSSKLTLISIGFSLGYLKEYC